MVLVSQRYEENYEPRLRFGMIVVEEWKKAAFSCLKVKVQQSPIRYEKNYETLKQKDLFFENGSS